MREDSPAPEAPIELRGLTLAATAAGLYLAVIVAARISAGLPRDGMLAPVWLANAFVVTALTASARKHWPYLVAAAAAGNLTALVLARGSLQTGLCLIPSNVFEYLFASLAFRRWTGGRPHLGDGGVLARLAIVCLAAGAGSGLLSSSLLRIVTGADLLGNLRTWSLAHILGLLTVTPCLMIVSQPRRYLGVPLGWRSVGSSLILLATAAVVFSQTRYPILFLIPPALVLVSLELETFGAAAGVLTIEAIALLSLYLHSGPMMLVHGRPADRASIVQIFLLACLGTSIPLATINVRRKQAMAVATRSEHKYRLLAENAGDMLIQYTADSEITFVTPSCQPILGLDPDELIGRRILDMTHPDDLERVTDYLEALAAAPGEPMEPLQFRVQATSGAWLWLEGQPKIFLDPASGRPASMQDVLRDVTSRKALEFKLSRAQAQAEAASMVKSEFLSNMSHELRTPLTSILGFTSLLQEEPSLGEQTLRFVKRIGGSSQHLLAIVNDILDFSKLEAGQVEIEPRPTRLGAALSESLAMLGPQAEAKDLRLVFAAGELPAVAMIDMARTRQVMLNLIGNAVKFTPAGSVTLAASYDRTLQRLRCEITDTGEGISETGLTRLFQRFSQVDGSTTRMHGGTGLGLAISKGLVEAMGGDIGATSTPGRGSTFWFELPCPSADEIQAEAVAQTRADLIHLDGLRLLMADDNPANREIVRLMLAPHGVELTEADSGEAAIQLARQAPFDLILMDIRMPGTDGPTAARAIRSEAGPNDTIPILAFTADVLGDDALPNSDNPFADRIEKPVVPNRLLTVLAHWANPDVHGQLAPILPDLMAVL